MHSDSSTSLSASRSIEAGMFLIVCRFGRRVAASPDPHRRAAALAQNGALFAPILPDPEDFVPPRATSHSSQSPSAAPVPTPGTRRACRSSRSLPPAHAHGIAIATSKSGYHLGPNYGPLFHVATVPAMLTAT